MTIPAPTHPFRLSSSVKTELRILADASANEVCGAIVMIKGRQVGLQMENVSETPDISFRFSDEETLQLYEECDRFGWHLQAIWHSHPRGDAMPSLTDVEYARLPMVIIGREDIQVHTTERNDHGTL